jgi:hypothetical protein
METESGKKEAELPSSIPEIYFDVIARVVPGAIAIAAYKFNSLSSNLNTPTISFALLCSYFIGMLLQVVGELIWKFWNNLKPKLPAVNPKLKIIELHPLLEIWDWLRHLPIAERPVFTKMLAERSMFQATALLGLFWIFFPPPIVLDNYHGSAWHITIPAFLAAFWGMLVVHGWLSWNKDIYSQGGQSRRARGER